MNKYKKLLKTIGVKLRGQLDDNKSRISKLSSNSQKRNYLESRPVLPKVNIYDLYDLLTTLFGDNWEINRNYLVVKYDSITVTNDNGETHTIKDFYIRYNWGNKFPEPNAYKATFTFGELDSCYLHSHVKCRFTKDTYKDDYKLWSSLFCFGDYMNDIRSNAMNKNTYTTDYLYMLITNIHEWLQEESSHTSPYSYISNVIQERDTKYSIPLIEMQETDFSALEVYEINDLASLSVVANTLEVIEKHPNFSEFLCYVTKNCNYTLDSKVKTFTPIEKSTDFYFNRKKVMFRIVNEEDSNLTPAIHPRIIKHFNEKINEHINSFKEEIIENYLKLYSANREESIESTSILLSADS